MVADEKRVLLVQPALKLSISNYVSTSRSIA